MSRTGKSRVQACPRRPIIVWDTETTGLGASKNRLVEIALQELPCTAATSAVYNFSSLIHPDGIEMPRAASRVHGITNSMMQDSPSFHEVWPELKEFVEDLSDNRGKPILVAHNLAFDLSFFKEELRRIGEPLPDWDFACSLRDVAHVLWPGHPASLAALAERFSVVNEEAHRALCDVEATCKILQGADEWLRELAAEKNPNEPLKPPGEYIRDIIETATGKRGGQSSVPATRMPTPSPSMHCETTRGQNPQGKENVDQNRCKTDVEKVVSSQPAGDSNEEPLEYFFVPQGDVYHNERSCVTLEAPDNVHSTRDMPSGRRLCLLCSESVTKVGENGENSQTHAEAPSTFFIAPMGSLYHLNRACPKLDIARTIHRVDDVPKGRQPCALCCSPRRNKGHHFR